MKITASGPITSWKIDGETMETMRDFIFLGSKITAEGDCQIRSDQSLRCVRLFATPWIAACQASLSLIIFWSLFKLMSIEAVIPSNHLSSVVPFSSRLQSFPASGFFSNESALRSRWPKCWSFSFSISPYNEYSGLISFGWTGWISLLSKVLSRVFYSIIVWRYQFFGSQPFLLSDYCKNHDLDCMDLCRQSNVFVF